MPRAKAAMRKMTQAAVRGGKNRRPLGPGNAGPRHLAHYLRRRVGLGHAARHGVSTALPAMCLTAESWQGARPLGSGRERDGADRASGGPGAGEPVQAAGDRGGAGVRARRRALQVHRDLEPGARDGNLALPSISRRARRRPVTGRSKGGHGPPDGRSSRLTAVPCQHPTARLRRHVPGSPADCPFASPGSGDCPGMS